MLDSRRKQNWKAFVVLAVLAGAGMIVAGGMLITSGAGPAISIMLMGIALIIGSVVVFRSCANMNQGKRDTSVKIDYQMQTRNGIEILEDIEMLRTQLEGLQPKEEIFITLSPEYFGLISWQFVRIKQMYLSFVTLRRKEKLQKYFIMPSTDVTAAMKPFAEVFVEKNAVNTALLIEMKRYRGMLEYYKLAE